MCSALVPHAFSLPNQPLGLSRTALLLESAGTVRLLAPCPTRPPRVFGRLLLPPLLPACLFGRCSWSHQVVSAPSSLCWNPGPVVTATSPFPTEARGYALGTNGQQQRVRPQGLGVSPQYQATLRRPQVSFPLGQPHWGILAPVTPMPRQKFASHQNSEVKRLVPEGKGSNTSHGWFSRSAFIAHLIRPLSWPSSFSPLPR